MARKRKTLTRMDDPYNGIILILELVGMHSPTLIELKALVFEEKEARDLHVQYNSGKEDILYFCWHQLKGPCGVGIGRFRLTQRAIRLAPVAIVTPILRFSGNETVQVPNGRVPLLGA